MYKTRKGTTNSMLLPLLVSIEATAAAVAAAAVAAPAAAAAKVRKALSPCDKQLQ
jgi:hypothetical protein